MKKLAYISAIFLMTFSILFVSCSKDDDEDDFNNNPGELIIYGGFNAKVNGEKWSFYPSCVIKDGVPLITGEGVYDLAITIENFAEGTYNFSGSSDNFAKITDSIASYSTLGEIQSSGSIEITSIRTDTVHWSGSDDHFLLDVISGNFEFVAIDRITGNTIEVTEGQFTHVKYVEENAPTGYDELQVEY